MRKFNFSKRFFLLIRFLIVIGCCFLMSEKIVYADAPIEDDSMNKSDGSGDVVVHSLRTSSASSDSVSKIDKAEVNVGKWKEVNLEKNIKKSDKEKVRNNSSSLSGKSDRNDNSVGDNSYGWVSSNESGDLGQRVFKLEKKVNSSDVISLKKQIEILQQNLQTLTGKIDEQSHSLDRMSKQVKSFYVDLDRRITDDKKRNEVNINNGMRNNVFSKEKLVGNKPKGYNNRNRYGNDGGANAVEVNSAATVVGSGESLVASGSAAKTASTSDGKFTKKKGRVVDERNSVFDEDKITDVSEINSTLESSAITSRMNARQNKLLDRGKSVGDVDSIDSDNRNSYKDAGNVVDEKQYGTKNESIKPNKNKSNEIPVSSLKFAEPSRESVTKSKNNLANGDNEKSTKLPTEEKINMKDNGVSSSKMESGKEITMDEQQMYQEAFESLQSKQFQLAIKKLKGYLNKYPDGVYSPNAHYWIGEVYFLNSSYSKAGNEFDIVITKYKSSPKVPEAMFKLAYIHDREGKHDQAKQEYENLTKKYPKSQAANLAKEQMSAGTE